MYLIITLFIVDAGICGPMNMFEIMLGLFYEDLQGRSYSSSIGNSLWHKPTTKATTSLNLNKFF